MLTIVSSQPTNLGGGQYIDAPMRIVFSDAIPSVYLTDEFFKLYRTNETLSEFYDAVSISITAEGPDVVLQPAIHLDKTSWYVMVVIGGPDGIRTGSDDTLSENSSIQFRTGDSIAPSTGVTTTINDIAVVVNDPTDPQVTNPSTDLFATEGAGAPIVLLSSIPGHHSVGVGDFSKIILTYNDEIKGTVPTSAFRVESHELPIAMDPFAVPTITLTTITKDATQLILDVNDVSVIPNTEYIVRIAANSVRGVTRKAYDADSHELRFISSLVPLYALPEQIRKRLTSFVDGANIQISDYDLYKLIHEKSLWVRDVLKVPVTQQTIILVNKLTICLVLKELLVTGLIMQGQIKSRDLLSTKIEYFQADLKSAIAQLETCASDAMAALDTGTFNVLHGIRAVQYLNRPVKAYDATYR